MDDHAPVATDELRVLAASYGMPDVDAEMVPLTDRTA
jgi:hypothetical protein